MLERKLSFQLYYDVHVCSQLVHKKYVYHIEWYLTIVRGIRNICSYVREWYMIYAKNCYKKDLALTLRGRTTIVDLLSVLDQGLPGYWQVDGWVVMPDRSFHWSFWREWLVILPYRPFHWSFLLRRGVSSTCLGEGQVTYLHSQGVEQVTHLPGQGAGHQFMVWWGGGHVNS